MEPVSKTISNVSDMRNCRIIPSLKSVQSAVMDITIILKKMYANLSCLDASIKDVTVSNVSPLSSMIAIRRTVIFLVANNMPIMDAKTVLLLSNPATTDAPLITVLPILRLGVLNAKLGTL